MESKYDNWTKDFMESWRSLDWKKTLSLLSEDVKYYENPIDPPCANFDEVIKLWEVVEKNQSDISYTYKIVAYNENVCIINWQMKRKFIPNNELQNIDGIFEISLNENGLCNSFKQWRYTRAN